MAVTRSNGRDLHYGDTGGDGPAVVLAHGYFLDRSMFAAQESFLPPRWRVVTWDARGHGGTVDDGVPFTYWDSARDLLGLMDALGIESAVVGGVSQGGFTALRAALLAPERVSGLVLFDTEAGACDGDDKVGYTQLFAALRTHGPVDDLVRPLAAQLIGDHPPAVEWVRRWQGAEHLPLGTPVDCLLERDDIVDRLPEITCPALLVRGAQDVSLPAERMTVLAERLPGASGVHSVDGAAHSPPLTHPDEVNHLLSEWLSRTQDKD